MGSRVRLWVISAFTAVLMSALGAQTPVSGRRTQAPVLVITSPPPGLGLPTGQHAGVRYRFTGETPAILELAADGITLFADQVQPGQEVTHAWTPARAGPHHLRVRVLAPDGTLLESAGLDVIGLPAGSRVRVP